MKIKLQGTEQEIEQFRDYLASVTTLTSCSTFYRDRSDSPLLRMYMEISKIPKAELRSSQEKMKSR